MAEEVKIRSVCVDTLTQIQENQYMLDIKKPGYDKWRDYGQDIYLFIQALIDLGFECILVLGSPGQGKSSGMRTLPPKTNIWFNADGKNPVWKGGKEEYGKKFNPKMPFHMIPKSYQDILNHIKGGLEKGMFEEERYAILTGHTETYREGLENKVRLKTLGNLSNKMQVEGKLESVFYAKTEKNESGEIQYILETQSDGFNTARSPQGAFEGKIENDYNHIINTLLNY